MHGAAQCGLGGREANNTITGGRKHAPMAAAGSVCRTQPTCAEQQERSEHHSAHHALACRTGGRTQARMENFELFVEKSFLLQL